MMHTRGQAVVNALTFDLEDWYQVTNFESVIGFDNWDKCESRLESSTQRLLGILRQANVKATFFVLGWNAERFPQLIKRIHQDGHEIGTHGYAHRLIYHQEPKEFAKELGRSIRVLTDIINTGISGHRAPSFSIVKESFWAFQILWEYGIKYDCSIFPINHHRYGVPDAPRFPFYVSVNGVGQVSEFPISTLSLLGRNIPFSGGGYFRLLPYQFIKWAIKYINSQRRPVMVYLHPWELDPGQPKLNVDRRLRFRHYLNLDKTEKKLRTLLRDFRFAPVKEVLANLELSKSYQFIEF